MPSALLPIAAPDVSAERDIHARAGTTSGSSTGALAAYLAGSCGHVWIDASIAEAGFRFHRAISDEIPHFFNRRSSIGSTRIALTLQGGITLEGSDPFADCASHEEAVGLLAGPVAGQSLWTVIVTIGGAMHGVSDIASPRFIAQRPAEFRMIAERLVSLGVLPASSCPLCCR